MNSESLKVVIQTTVRRTMLALVTLGFFVLDPELSFAQSTAFVYQGTLSQNNTPVNSPHDFEFRLFDASVGGVQQGSTVAVDDLGVTNGLFMLVLDFGAAAFPGAERWLEIATRHGTNTDPYTLLIPRQLISSTPYALRAAYLSGPLAATQLTGTIPSNNIGVGTITTDMLAAGAVSSKQLAVGAVTAANVATITVPLSLTTLTNPAPASDEFGTSVSAVGADRVLIGASWDDSGALNAGAAYLFSTAGALITTFTNPTPAANDSFGHSVAALGNDRVLIGAYLDGTGASEAGAAYLFRTNGALLTAFTNPLPAAGDYFGASVAAVGTDRVLIGAPYANRGATDNGMTYLFSTNGTLITTFTNPTPADFDYFGGSVIAFGSDRVLISAYSDDTGAIDAGAVYLFSTNGLLLTTFTNPSPGFDDSFGISVAAMGTDRVLIGAYGDDTGAGTDAGAAYLFNINGALLTTFTNPAPAFGDSFGFSVAAVGNDRVLIGAYGDDVISAGDAGVVYLFSTNGTLLTTLTNPTPAFFDRFGSSVTALGSDRVLIGSPGDDTGANDAGVAHLFSLETFTQGLVADGVNDRSITTASLQDGAVTLAKLDPTIGVWTRSGDNIFRVTGNVGIGTNSFTSNRLQVAGMVGASAFNTTSDRAAKQDFTAVDTQTVLAKLVALPITQWRFKDFPGVIHLGPTAQDFQAAFGLGVDDKSIATVDADGVALAAIQGLNQKLEETRAELRLRDAESVELKRRLQQLEQLVDTIRNGKK